MSYNRFNKNIVFARSKYEQVNNIVLNACLNRIDKNNYNTKIIHKENVIQIIVIPKIEGV